MRGLRAGARLGGNARRPARSSLFRLFTDSGHISVRSLVQDYSMPLAKGAQLGVHWDNERVVIKAALRPGLLPPIIPRVPSRHPRLPHRAAMQKLGKFPAPV